jgi:hypothetical protein
MFLQKIEGSQAKHIHSPWNKSKMTLLRLFVCQGNTSMFVGRNQQLILGLWEERDKERFKFFFTGKKNKNEQCETYFLK